MNEEPAAGVHEKAAIAGGLVAIASSDLSDLHLTGRKQVDARDGLVANSHVTSNRGDSEVLEVAEVLEEGVVGRAHSQLHLGELGHHTEVAHLLLSQRH